MRKHWIGKGFHMFKIFSEGTLKSGQVLVDMEPLARTPRDLHKADQVQTAPLACKRTSRAIPPTFHTSSSSRPASRWLQFAGLPSSRLVCQPLLHRSASQLLIVVVCQHVTARRLAAVPCLARLGFVARPQAKGGYDGVHKPMRRVYTDKNS